MKGAWPWLALLAALALATAPALRLAFGFAPSMEDLLEVRRGLW